DRNRRARRPGAVQGAASAARVRCLDESAGRHHHGLLLRLGDPARRRRDPGEAAHCARGAGGVRPPHARPPLRIRLGRALPRVGGPHRRCRRRGASARHDRRQDESAGPRRSGAVESAERPRFPALDRADAGGGAGRHLRDRQRGRCQRRALRRGHPGRQTSRDRGGPRGLPREPDGRGARQSGSARRAALMTVGIVGAGQLGRMLALAGYPLGLDFLFLDPAREAPAGRIAPVLHGSFTDPKLLSRLARECEVLTFDWENVSVEALRAHAAAAHGARICPPIRALATGQDRVAEKRLFERLGIPTTRWHAVGSPQELRRALDRIGLPGVLKTRRLGYDGKGQAVVRSAAQAAAAWRKLGRAPLLYEEWVDFDCEVSIIGARGAGGATAVYPLCGNVHGAGILRLTLAPFGPSRWQRQAARYLTRVLEHFRYRGILTIEFFVRRGKLIANELAPRVHNSGHWTIEGAVTSQFENHLR